ncbi:MAG: hypothetical protein ACI4HI_06220 [Lachnospiraceae bacterium]
MKVKVKVKVKVKGVARMLFIFYNEELNVLVWECKARNGTYEIVRQDLFLNTDADAKYFAEKMGVDGDFLDKVIKISSERFRGTEVFIFDQRRDRSVYDAEELSDLFLINYKNVHVLRVKVSEAEVRSMILWMSAHRQP